MKKSRKSTTGVRSGTSVPLGSSELTPGAPHDSFVVADTSKTMTAALTTPSQHSEQALQTRPRELNPGQPHDPSSRQLHPRPRRLP